MADRAGQPGDDLLGRLIHGARFSLLIGFMVVMLPHYTIAAVLWAIVAIAFAAAILQASRPDAQKRLSWMPGTLSP